MAVQRPISPVFLLQVFPKSLTTTEPTAGLDPKQPERYEAEPVRPGLEDVYLVEQIADVAGRSVDDVRAMIGKTGDCFVNNVTKLTENR